MSIRRISLATAASLMAALCVANRPARAQNPCVISGIVAGAAEAAAVGDPYLWGGRQYLLLVRRRMARAGLLLVRLCLSSGLWSGAVAMGGMAGAAVDRVDRSADLVADRLWWWWSSPAAVAADPAVAVVVPAVVAVEPGGGGGGRPGGGGGRPGGGGGGGGRDRPHH